MEYRKSERGELNVFFTNDEVRQIAAITDYINRLYPKLDEVLLEFSPEYAQEQAAFWKAIADDASRASVDAEGYGLLSYTILDRTADGLTLSLREGSSSLLGNSLMYSAYDQIPQNESLSVSKDKCRELENEYYAAIQTKLIAYGAGPLLANRRAR